MFINSFLTGIFSRKHKYSHLLSDREEASPQDFSSNSEANDSELLEILQAMFPRYCIESDIKFYIIVFSTPRRLATSSITFLIMITYRSTVVRTH